MGTVEVPCSQIRTPPIVGQEETPKVGSLLPVDQNPSTDKHNSYTRICISNSAISVRVIMT